MGQAACRVGDTGIGVCAAHPIPITVVVTLQTGESNFILEGSNIATSISIGLASCGHTSLVVTTSSIMSVNNNFVHRVNDTGILPGGTYTMLTGSSKLFLEN